MQEEIRLATSFIPLDSCDRIHKRASIRMLPKRRCFFECILNFLFLFWDNSQDRIDYNTSYNGQSPCLAGKLSNSFSKGKVIELFAIVTITSWRERSSKEKRKFQTVHFLLVFTISWPPKNKENCMRIVMENEYGKCARKTTSFKKRAVAKEKNLIKIKIKWEKRRTNTAMKRI